MAISNTSILIKRSLTTGRPSSAQQGEFAYSYASNTLFIGTPGGNGVVNVGGQFYTSTIDSATSSNVASTLVKRDASGAFYGNHFGNSNTATTLLNGRNFNIGGGDITSDYVGFDGSSSVTLNASLNTITGLTAGTYGSTTSIPVVTVAANGRVTSVSTESISTSFNLYGNSGVTAVAGGDSLTLSGASGSGITTNASVGPSLSIGVDDTIFRSNTYGATQIILTDISVQGNLFIHGNTTTIDVSSINIDSPLIYLAANNYTSDLVDIGFAANYFDGSEERHTGFFRDFSTKQYYLFDNLTQELSSNNAIDRGDSSFRIATLTANIADANINTSQIYNSSFTNGTISDLTSALAVTDGGIGTNFLNNGEILLGGDSGAVHTLANVSSINTSLSSNHTVDNFTTDVYGRVTNYTSQAISGLTVSQGGTGLSTIPNGQILIGNDTGSLVSLANTNTAGTYGSASYVPVITTDVWGRVSSVSNTEIYIDASQISSGVVPITHGGTNNNTFNNNTLVYYSGGSIVSLANVSYTATGSGASNNTVSSLTVDNFGRVSAATFTAISGLTVAQGGTGLSSITTNGITFGNGAGNLGVTAAAGTSDQTWSNQILTVNNSGVPIWASAMDGGVF